MARGLKFGIWEVEGLYYLCSENKTLTSFAITAKLICVFVFAYAKSRFSHDEAPIILLLASHLGLYCLLIGISLKNEIKLKISPDAPKIK